MPLSFVLLRMTNAPFRRLALLLVGGLLLAATPVLAPAHADHTDAPADRVHHARPGPWGDLEYVRIVIEPPDDFMAGDYTTAPARWNFAGYDGARLDALIRESVPAGALRDQLLDPRLRETTADGIALNPTLAILESLPTDARALIYNTLSTLPGNELQSEPFRFRADRIDEWFENSGVRDDVVARIRSLLYPRGNALLFSDPGLVLPMLATPGERVRLIKTLARKSTLMVKLRVRPDSDIDQIADYWSSRNRRKDIRPLLLSLSRQPGGMTIDLAHLLPRLARGLLYTYPSPEVPFELSPDCHWTSMNFFNDPPDDRLMDLDYLKARLIVDYSEIKSEPQLGDIVMMMRPDGTAVHSSVYLADNIVFTKNGQSATVPWLLTTLPDLQAFYPSTPPLLTRIYRRRQ